MSFIQSMTSYHPIWFSFVIGFGNIYVFSLHMRSFAVICNVLLYCREIITLGLLLNMPVITSINQLKQEIRPCREIAIQRMPGYKHHAFVGNVDEYGCDLYHYSCNLESALDYTPPGKITRTTLYFENRSFEGILHCNFDNGDKLYLIERDDYPNDEEAEKNCIKRAQSRVGEEMFLLVYNNCECYVNWIFSNDNSSKQITTSIKNRAVGNAFDGMFSTGLLRPLLHAHLSILELQDSLDKEEKDQNEYHEIKLWLSLRYEEGTLKLSQKEKKEDKRILIQRIKSEAYDKQTNINTEVLKSHKETNDSTHMMHNLIKQMTHLTTKKRKHDQFFFEEKIEALQAKTPYRKLQEGNNNQSVLLGVLFLSISMQQYYGNYTLSSKNMIPQNEEVVSKEVALYVENHSLIFFDTATWEEFAENLQSLILSTIFLLLLFFSILIRQIYVVKKYDNFTPNQKKNIIAREVFLTVFGVAGSVLVQTVIPKSCIASLVCGMVGNAVGGIIGGFFFF